MNKCELATLFPDCRSLANPLLELQIGCQWNLYYENGKFGGNSDKN